MKNKNLIINIISELREKKELNQWTPEIQNFSDIYRKIVPMNLKQGQKQARHSVIRSFKYLNL